MTEVFEYVKDESYYIYYYYYKITKGIEDIMNLYFW